MKWFLVLAATFPLTCFAAASSEEPMMSMEWQQCHADSDCIAVPAVCDDHSQAVNRKFKKQYRKWAQKLSTQMHCGIGKAVPQNAFCQKKICQLKPPQQ